MSLAAVVDVLAVVATVAVIQGLATAAAALALEAFNAIFGLSGPRSFDAGEQASLTAARLAAALFTFQAVTVAGTLLAIRIWRLPAGEILRLWAPGTGSGLVVLAILGLLVSAAAYAFAIYNVDRSALVQDISQFKSFLDAPTWWLIALAAAVGAPIAEEILFRGYLYGVLRDSRLGPMLAAAVSAALWAGLHFSYTIYGIAAIFLIGLYLAWLRDRTGGLLAPILAHSIYNAMIVAVLLALPDSMLAATGPQP